MKLQMRYFLTGWFVLLFLASSLQAAPAKTPATFHIGGAVVKAGDWSVQKVKRDFSKEIINLNYTLKGKKYFSRCVPLLSLIQAAQPRFPDKGKHPELRFLIKVQGKDGYSVWFSMGELSPDFGKRKVYLALDVNNQPFQGKEAPVRLIVPDEKDYGRWIYGIKAITIVDASSLKVR
jgi:hypothetical protein